jgi:acetyl-CoA/propionyl-CoA carboxylase biotin carboxyl carrier protein
MKVVASADEAADQLASAQREALAYFGRDECYVERYLTKPRHIEVQILADTHGNAVYLGTRDCSAQRRHQKLIEEAPAVGIPADTIRQMGEAAVAVAKGCDYTNAGTVEFLYEDGGFYYLEMNTRLQVEHPATELVTGVDLVEQQLRIASGEPLAFTQNDIEIRGHSIEVRINAEDPAGGAFLPSPGPITALTPPDGFGTRWDTGYEAGDEISQFYDNLIGKLIVWGRDRDVAINRALRALGELTIEGIATTIPADIAILEHDDFRANEHSTKWVEEVLDLSGVSTTGASTVEDDEPKIKREVDVEVNGKRFSVAMWVPESTAAVPAGGSTRRRRGGTSGATGASGSGEVTVPMQGTIVKVNVSVGDTVAIGDVIIVLEAMKMENNVTAEKAGTVIELGVAEGDSVGGGDVVAVIG